MNKFKDNKGSLTVETAIVLPVFICGFLIIAMLGAAVKAQVVVQYAINQTAKEISQYFYIVNKLGLNDDTSGVSTEKTDEILSNLNSFQSSIGGAGSDIKSIDVDFTNFDKMGEQYKNISGDVVSIKSSGEQLYKSLADTAQNPTEVIATISALMKSGASKVVIGRLIAQPLCKIIVPKYITNSGDVDKTLANMGIMDGDRKGLDAMDFGLSNFLIDGKTINVVVVYKLKPVGFNIVDYEFKIKQTASTSAWGGPTLESVKEENKNSPWNLGSFEYGRIYADELRSEWGSNAVEPGQGIDAYIREGSSGMYFGQRFPANSFVEVHALNVFSDTYSTYSKDPDTGKAVYSFNEENSKKVRSTIKSYITQLDNDIEKINNRKKSIKMADGTKVDVPSPDKAEQKGYVVIVIPEDATNEAKSMLNDIAKELKAETGYEVLYTYRDKALDP